MDGQKICSRCGSAGESSAIFCTACGQNLTQPPVAAYQPYSPGNPMPPQQYPPAQMPYGQIPHEQTQKTSKSVPALAIVGIVALVLVFLGFGAFLVVSSLSVFDSMVANDFRPLENVSVREELSDVILYDQDIIAQLSPEFMNADVDIEGSSRIAESPSVERDGSTSTFHDPFFNLTLVVPEDTFRDDVVDDGWGYYFWMGDSETYNFLVDIYRMGEAGDSLWRSSQAEAVSMAASTWEGDNNTLIESGVLTISGEEYVYVRYQPSRRDTHHVDIVRSIDGIIIHISYSLYDTSIETMSLFEH
ncbi:MAG: hypothetical protein FWC86_06425 [Coriobacteriia bacterium]|nr:hypothetical protein [Coriobacteriia bacterium]